MNWVLLNHSLLVAAGATAAAVVLGFVAALFAFGLGRFLGRIVTALAIMAIALPPFLVTNCWLHFLGQNGVWRQWLPANIVSFGGTMWILALLLWPISMFFTIASWRRIEPAYFEVDPKLRGTGLLRHLLWPMAWRELIQAAVLTFVLALNNFAVPSILQVKVYPAEVFTSFVTTFDYTAALQLGWPLIIAPLCLLVVFHRERVSWLWRTNRVSGAEFRAQLGKPLFLTAAMITIITLVLSDVLPLVQLVLSRQTWANMLPTIGAGHGAVVHSILFAATSATVVVTAGLLTARLPLRFAGWVTFLIPGVLLGILIIRIFNQPPFVAFYQSVGIVILAFAIRYFAPARLAITEAVENVDRNLSDAARVEGANRWQLFRYAVLPQIAPQLCLAWYVTYIFCLWDVETLVLIVPPGCETVALRIFNLLHYGYNAQVNALCLLLLGLALLPLALASMWRFGLHRRSCLVSLAPAILALVFAGCSGSGGVQQNSHFPVSSKLFDHVEIIGCRGTAPGQFNKPRSVAVDTNDNLFVIDMTGRVQKFSAAGRYVSSWQMPQTDLGRPKGMGTDRDGNIIVVEPHYSRINHFSPSGELVKQWGTHGTNDGQLAFPRAVAMNSRGEMFVSEYSLVERVQVFSGRGDHLVKAFGKLGDGAGEFNRAEGLGIDAQDRLYVADSCNHRIQIFSPDGKFLRSHGKAGSNPGEFSYPYDVRVDAAGFQFVCEFGNSRLQVFDSQDQLVEVLGEPGAKPGQFANPWSLALDSAGNLYVADSQNHWVQKFVRRQGTAIAGHKSQIENSGEVGS